MLVAFYEGGLSYSEARQMPLQELLLVNKAADKLSRERKKAVEKAANGQ